MATVAAIHEVTFLRIRAQVSGLRADVVQTNGPSAVAQRSLAHSQGHPSLSCQRREELLLPPQDVHTPDDLGPRAAVDGIGPSPAIQDILSNIEPVDDGHPPREVAGS